MTKMIRAECDFGGPVRMDVLANADAQVLQPGSSPLQATNLSQPVVRERAIKAQFNRVSRS